MPTIRTYMLIHAPIERCFDLSRDIDIHMASTSHTQERAVAGRTSGLIGLGETVTWEAVHFGIRQRLTSKITAFDRPRCFVDEMISGAFQRFKHVHTFEPRDGGTWMTDTFDYTSPLGLLGRIADWLFLRAYMERLLVKRNEYIKYAAENRHEP